jgi:hypothetical protein
MLNAKICYFDSILEFRRLGLEGSKTFHHKWRNREVVKSREDLGRRIWGIYEGSIVIRYGKDVRWIGQSWIVGSIGRVAKYQSTTKTPSQSFAGREFQRKGVQTSEMRDHENIRTVRSPRTWTIDLSSISESHLSRLGVTRTSITGIMICELTIRSRPSIHQDYGPLI